ncbi:MAG: ABC transporter ATP-binding protein [Firmicutes bacterium]|nr:ABC transporter ATP-binding protein [Bacillota bacterium]
MRNIHEEETLGKAYDSKLMKRLLSYAKPYFKYILLSLILLIFATIVLLARPYVMQIAIDDYITAYKKPMYVFDKGNAPIEGISYKNNIYVRENKLTEKEKSKYSDKEIKSIYKFKGEFYLIDGSIKSPKENVTIKTNGKKATFKTADNSYSATLLSKDEYKTFRQNDIDNLSKLGIIYLILITIGFISHYAQKYILNYSSKKIIFNIRQEIFSHLQKMSLSFFDNNPVGRLVTRVANDTEKLNEMYSQVLVKLINDILLLLGIVVIMIKMNYKLALLSFSVVPIILIASAIFRSKIRKIYRIVRVRLAKINSTLNENITGMKTVHIFNKHNKKFKEFDKINQSYLDATKKEIRVYALFRPSIEIIRSLGIASIIYYGGGQVVKGTIEFGVLYAFINYLQQFFRPIMEMTQKYNILQSAMAASERLFQILDKEADIKNNNKPISFNKLKGKIEFKNVWFAYEKDNWVLKDVSFTINPGDSVAFVGATGAGKSSIINLISRFYDIQKGEILIDDINIKNLDKFQLRKRIGIVLQEVFLFTGDIKDNIRLNNKGISKKEIKEISKYVNAEKFIENLPKKYDEPVMERGATLSAGQKQLLAFARALAFNPDILILDEATSNIDTETELLIQDALVKLIKNRTSIAVAHRLSTIQHSDKIIVLHKGEVKEQGTHQQLLDKGGFYYDLYRLQYKDDFHN